MAQYPFFFDGGLPFCPYILTENDVLSWDQINKGAWLEFSDINDIIELYWRPKTLKVQGFNSTNGSPTSLCWQGSPFEWNGSSWAPTPDVNDDVKIYYESSTPILNLTAKKNTSLIDSTNTDGFPYDFICGPERSFRGSTLGTDIDHSVEITLFYDTRPDISGGFSGFPDTTPLLYDPFSQLYYVGVEYRWMMSISDTTWPILDSDPPPPSTKYSTSGGTARTQFFNGSSGDNGADLFSNLNVPLNITMSGSTATLYLDEIDSTALNPDTESFTVSIADSFPYFDSDS